MIIFRTWKMLKLINKMVTDKNSSFVYLKKQRKLERKTILFKSVKLQQENTKLI